MAHNGFWLNVEVCAFLDSRVMQFTSVQLRLFPLLEPTRDAITGDEAAHLMREGWIVTAFVDMSTDTAVSKLWLHSAILEHPWLVRTAIDDMFGRMSLWVPFVLESRDITIQIQVGGDVATFDDPWETVGEDLPPGMDLRLGKYEVLSGTLKLREKLYMNDTMIVRPSFQGRNFRVDPRLCFVVMPFTEAWSEPVFTQIIQPAAEAGGLKCKRADNFFSPGAVVEDVWAGINSAFLLIVDVTGRNPNAYYELGLAHVIGVPTIIITQDETPAFDVAHLRYITYSNSPSGHRRLQLQLTSTIEEFVRRVVFP